MGKTAGRHETPDAGTLTPLARLRPPFMAGIALTFGALLLLLGGRWDWIEGWILAALFFAHLGGTSLWAVRYAPGLSSERVRAVAHPGSVGERLILFWVVVIIVALLVVAALDGGRFRWSQVPIWVKGAGFALLAAYVALNLWVMVHNAYLSAVVRVQEERGHMVVTAGPYRFNRHPMYAAICLLAANRPSPHILF